MSSLDVDRDVSKHDQETQQESHTAASPWRKPAKTRRIEKRANQSCHKVTHNKPTSLPVQDKQYAVETAGSTSSSDTVRKKYFVIAFTTTNTQNLFLTKYTSMVVPVHVVRCLQRNRVRIKWWRWCTAWIIVRPQEKATAAVSIGTFIEWST